MEEILSKLNQIYQKQELCAQLLDNYIWENFLVMRARSLKAEWLAAAK